MMNRLVNELGYTIIITVKDYLRTQLRPRICECEHLEDDGSWDTNYCYINLYGIATRRNLIYIFFYQYAVAMRRFFNDMFVNKKSVVRDYGPGCDIYVSFLPPSFAVIHLFEGRFRASLASFVRSSASSSLLPPAGDMRLFTQLFCVIYGVAARARFKVSISPSVSVTFSIICGT